ncbi:HSP90h [Malus domestica virus A]|uniref:HSP90h n=1 Tax=Malus domestica virus A TaxID=2664236 RepID=A0A5Q0TZG3_9CLOS|nr:HSP90h [Malus domestica virus A]QGA73179.1 HSP90h [Malus domestica virus A]
MELSRNALFRRVFEALHFKSKVDKEFDEYIKFLKSDIVRLNRQSFVSSQGGLRKKYESKFYLKDGLIMEGDLSIDDVIFLMCDYFSNFNVDYKVKSPYPIANVIGFYSHPETTEVLEVYKDKSLEQIAADNPTLGCRYTKAQVLEKYPELSGASLEFTYRLSNSLGRLVKPSELSSGDLKVFEVKRFSQKVSEISEDPVLGKLCEYIDDYITVESSEADQKLFGNMITMCSLIYIQLDPKKRDVLYQNEVFRGLLYKLIRRFKNSVVNGETRFNLLNVFNAEFADDVKTLFNCDIIVDHIKAIRSPEISSREIFDVAILRDIAFKTKMSMQHKDLSHCLSERSDVVLLQIFCDYFNEIFSISSKELVEALVLVFFSFLSTSNKILDRNEEFSFQYKADNGATRDLTLNSKHFLSYVEGRKDALDARDVKRNIYRLFCSKRANYAIMVNEQFGFKPNLFSVCKLIQGHMRIDFWKGLRVEFLTQEEEKSYLLLKAITEYHSRRDEKSKNNYYKLIGII